MAIQNRTAYNYADTIIYVIVCRSKNIFTLIISSDCWCISNEFELMLCRATSAKTSTASYRFMKCIGFALPIELCGLPPLLFDSLSSLYYHNSSFPV